MKFLTLLLPLVCMLFFSRCKPAVEYHYSYYFYPESTEKSTQWWEKDQQELKRRFEDFLGKNGNVKMYADSIVVQSVGEVPDAIFDQYLLSKGKFYIKSAYSSETAIPLLNSINDAVKKMRNFEYITDAEALRLSNGYLDSVLFFSKETESPSLGFVDDKNLYLVKHLLDEKPLAKLIPSGTHISIIRNTNYTSLYEIWLIKDDESHMVLTGKNDILNPVVEAVKPQGFALYFTMATPFHQQWKEFTNKNTGSNVAFMLDNAVLACPKVNDAIADGNTQLISNARTSLLAIASVLKTDTLSGNNIRWTYGY
jgi:hypothetical protein